MNELVRGVRCRVGLVLKTLAFLFALWAGDVQAQSCPSAPVGGSCTVTGGAPGTCCALVSSPSTKLCFASPPSSSWNCGSGGGGGSSSSEEEKRKQQRREALLAQLARAQGRLSTLRDMMLQNFGPWATTNPFAIAEDLAQARQEVSDLQQELQQLGRNYSPVRPLADPVEKALRERSLNTERAIEVVGGIYTERSKASGEAGPSAPGFAATTIGGEAGLKFDLTRALQLSAYEKLIAYVGVGASKISGDSFSNALTGGFKSDALDVPVGILYKAGPYYASGTGLFSFGKSSYNQTGTIQGSADNRGWGLLGTFGRDFQLWSAKRPDGTVPSLIGWRGLLLDLSGHVGTVNGRENSFYDTAGTYYADVSGQRSFVGADARLVWYYRGSDYWMRPYISGGYDYAFRNYLTNDPALLPYYQDFDKNVWKAEIGVNVTSLSQLAVTGRAYWRGGDTTQTTGFSLDMKVPFGAR